MIKIGMGAFLKKKKKVEHKLEIWSLFSHLVILESGPSLNLGHLWHRAPETDHPARTPSSAAFWLCHLNAFLFPFSFFFLPPSPHLSNEHEDSLSTLLNTTVRLEKVSMCQKRTMALGTWRAPPPSYLVRLRGVLGARATHVWTYTSRLSLGCSAVWCFSSFYKQLKALLIVEAGEGSVRLLGLGTTCGLRL